jgi:hypothetical protein
MLETLATAMMFCFVMPLLYKLMLLWIGHELAHPHTKRD